MAASAANEVMLPTPRRFPTLVGRHNRLVSLSLGQVIAIAVASIGGLVVWILAARMFAPIQVGRASSLITLGGLLSTVIAAGLGQYLLAALAGADNRGRLLTRVMAGGVCASVLVPALVGLLLYQASGLSSIVLLATIAATVTLTTLQDALYVCAGSTRDIAAKAGAITLARLASLALLGPMILGVGGGDYWLLVILLTIPQLAVAATWLAVRSPSLMNVSMRPRPARPTYAMLSVGYAVALGSAAVTWGLPAVVTSELEPGRAALFYTSWVLGSIVGTIPASLANAVVASAPTISTRHVTGVVGMQLLVSIGLLLCLVAGAPWLSQLFGTHYNAMPSVLPAIAIGQLGVGVSVVLIAYMRLAGNSTEVVAASGALALLASIAPAVITARLGEGGFFVAFVIGSWAAVLMSAMLLIRRLRDRGIGHSG